MAAAAAGVAVAVAVAVVVFVTSLSKVVSACDSFQIVYSTLSKFHIVPDLDCASHSQTMLHFLLFRSRSR